MKQELRFPPLLVKHDLSLPRDQLLPNSQLTPEQLHLSMNSLLLHLVAYPMEAASYLLPIL